MKTIFGTLYAVYNKDEKALVFDTVDARFGDEWLKNVEMNILLTEKCLYFWHMCVYRHTDVSVF